MPADRPARHRQNTVKNCLTPKPVVENGDYAAFARRILRAYARRISAGDVDALADITVLAADVEAAIRQAAQQRWGDAQP